MGGWLVGQLGWLVHRAQHKGGDSRGWSGSTYSWILKDMIQHKGFDVVYKRRWVQRQVQLAWQCTNVGLQNWSVLSAIGMGTCCTDTVHFTVACSWGQGTCDNDAIVGSQGTQDVSSSYTASVIVICDVGGPWSMRRVIQSEGAWVRKK